MATAGVDFYVANDGVDNLLWLNRGAGRFEENGLLAGVAVNGDGTAEASMGIAVADFDRDDDPDLFVTHDIKESNTLYVNDGRGWFEDRSVAAGVGASSLPYTAFGAGWVDVDNDGDLDLLSVNGAVAILEPQLAAGIEPPLRQVNQILLNDGRGRYADRGGGPAFRHDGISRGAAFGDLDNDGDVDVVVANNDGPARLYRNESTPANWLGLELEGGGRAPHATGALVWRDTPRPERKRVRTDGSYASAHDPRLLFGLADDDAPQFVRVRWPDAAEQRFGPLAVNRYHVLRQGAPLAEAGREPVPATASGSKQAVPPPDEAAHGVRFVDRHRSGRHRLRARQRHDRQRWLAEIMGAGVAVFDFDGDGRLDIWLVQGGPLAQRRPATLPGDRLYRSVGDGELRFRDVTAQSGVRATGYGMGIATGDIDNDGDLDVFLANFGANQLYENLGGGRFRDITAASGLAGGGSAEWSVGASFADMDGDGLDDLYVANYVDFSLDNHKTCRDLAARPTYCAPDSYRPTSDRLYRNLGDGRFVDVSVAAGIGGRSGGALGVVAEDFDGDGRTDFYVANDPVDNLLWLNQGDGRFVDRALLAGAAVDGDGDAGMGRGCRGLRQRLRRGSVPAPSRRRDRHPLRRQRRRLVRRSRQPRRSRRRQYAVHRLRNSPARRRQRWRSGSVQRQWRRCRDCRPAGRRHAATFPASQPALAERWPGQVPGDSRRACVRSAGGQSRRRARRLGQRRRPRHRGRQQQRPGAAVPQRLRPGALAGGGTAGRRRRRLGQSGMARTPAVRAPPRGYRRQLRLRARSAPAVRAGCGHRGAIRARPLAGRRGGTFRPPCCRPLPSPGTPPGQVAVRSLAAWLVLALAASAAAGPPAESPVRLEGLSPALAEALRNARAETQRQAAVADAAARAAAWGRLGMFYHAQHLSYAAEDAYGRALAAVDQPRWRYLRAIVLEERGELEQAVADYRRVASADPDNIAAWYRLGAGLLLKGDVAGAEAALAQADQRLPDSALVLATLADVAVAREQWPAARELLERAWALEPDAGQLAYKLAMLHRRLGDAEAAREWLARRDGDNAAPKIDDPLLLEVAQMSRSARFFVKAGQWALARGDHEGAVQALEQAVALAPDDEDIGLTFAHVLGVAGRGERGLREVGRVLERAAESARGWYLRAWLLRTSTDDARRQRALAAARRSLALAEDERTRTLAAALSMREGRFAEAAADYERLAAAHPDEAYYPYWLALARLGKGDCRARSALARALHLQAKWGEAHLVRARADALCGDREAARRRATALLEVRNDADTRLTLALVELASGHADKAKALASAELPHPDAAMVLNALDGDTLPQAPFAAESAWWLPPEVR